VQWGRIWMYKINFIVYSQPMLWNKIEQIKDILSRSRQIAIVSHRNPDGDAYGSSLGLLHFLKKMGHKVNFVTPNDCPNFLKWMPGVGDILIFEEDQARAGEVLENAEIVFALDFNALNRVGNEMQAILEKIDPVFVLIDHHPDPDDFADFTFVDVKICSTSQMIYQLMESLGGLGQLDKEMASCLYAGILTDTGSFRFPNTSGDTHRIVAHFHDLGIDHTKIYGLIYENSFDRLKLLGKAINNLVYLKDYRTAYITMSNHELNKFNYQKGDTEGLVNYALSLTDVIFAAIFIEDKQQGIIKISFRSKGDFNVNELSRAHFNGGGHINAAGGRSEKSLNETVAEFLGVLPLYKESLMQGHE